jgi:bleomycin hydrolase
MSLINDPRNPYSRAYTVARLGNIVGGGDIKYVNTTIATIKKLAVDVLKSGSPVWFGCDVGKQNLYKHLYSIPMITNSFNNRAI